MGEKFNVPNRGGRPLKLNDELIEKIAQRIRIGAYIETAVCSCGVSKASFHEWMKKGNEQKTGIYRRFLDAVEKAMYESEMDDVARLAQLGKEDLATIKWRMERKYTKRWGKREIIKTETDDTKNSSMDEENIHQHIVDLVEKCEAEPGTNDDDD